MENLKKESNGFLDCVSTLGFEPAGAYNLYRVCRGKVYTFSLKQYKDAYDGLCDEYNRHATYEEFLMWMDEVCYVSTADPEKMISEYKEWRKRQDEKDAERAKVSSLIKIRRAEYENACDDLYFGYGYNFWRSHNNGIADDEEAKLIWRAAVDKMANS